MRSSVGSGSGISSGSSTLGYSSTQYFVEVVVVMVVKGVVVVVVVCSGGLKTTRAQIGGEGQGLLPDPMK